MNTLLQGCRGFNMRERLLNIMLFIFPPLHLYFLKIEIHVKMLPCLIVLSQGRFTPLKAQSLHFSGEGLSF